MLNPAAKKRLLALVLVVVAAGLLWLMFGQPSESDRLTLPFFGDQAPVRTAPIHKVPIHKAPVHKVSIDKISEDKLSEDRVSAGNAFTQPQPKHLQSAQPLPAQTYDSTIAPGKPGAFPVAVDPLIADYGVIAGGWFLNERCEVLPPEVRDIFAELIHDYELYIERQLGETPQMQLVQQRARTFAYSEKYGKCGGRAQQIVYGTMMFLREWKDGTVDTLSVPIKPDSIEPESIEKN